MTVYAFPDRRSGRSLGGAARARPKADRVELLLVGGLIATAAIQLSMFAWLWLS